MENTYGIGIANRYELFYDQDDVTEFETVTTKKKEKKAKEPAQQQTTAPANGVQQKSVAEKENKVVKKENGPGPLKAPVDQQQRRGIKEQQNNSNKDNSTRKEGENKGFSSSNPRPAFNKTGGNGGGENREERNNRRNREMNGTTDFEKQPRQPNRRNFDDGRKRQRDRQSGSDKTGVKSVDKRDGAGAHNWGSHKQDIDDINKPPTDDENKEGGEETVEDSTPAAPVEEEPKEMTLDEWKAQRQAQLVQPQYNLRKAGEGEDNAQWDKMKRLDKKTGDGETSRRDAEAAAAIKREADAKKKQVLEIDFHFNDGRRGGLGRRPNPGGRGTGGERGDRGGDRGERRPPREGGADRGDRRPRPNRENAVEGGQREGGHREGGHREGGHREGGHREGGHREGGHREGGHREGGAEGANQGERRPPRRPRFENNRRGDFNGAVVPHAPKVDDERDFPSLG